MTPASTDAPLRASCLATSPPVKAAALEDDQGLQPRPVISSSVWQTVTQHPPPGHKTVEGPSYPPAQPAVHLHL